MLTENLLFTLAAGSAAAVVGSLVIGIGEWKLRRWKKRNSSKNGDEQ